MNRRFMQRAPRAALIGLGVLLVGAQIGVDHGPASAADCTHASCADPAWVTACNAADACAKIDQLKAPATAPPWTTKRSYTPASGVPDPSTERDVRRLGPKVKIRKRPVVAANKVVTPYTPPPPNAAWASAPSAPPVQEFDRRGLVMLGHSGKGAPTHDLTKSYGSALARFKVLAGVEDSTTGDPTRAKEDAAVLNQHPTWVGNPLRGNYRIKSPQWAVNSCEEYGYKKQFEYMWFSESAVALGSDYRAIYDLATRGDSPVRQKDRVLHTFGPDNATYWLREDYDHHDLTVQGTNLIQLYATGSLGSYDTPYKPDPGASPWENQAKMEAAHRSITDEELADIERRMRRFSDLLSQLWGADFAIAEADCKRKGYPGVQGKGFDFECLGKPGDKPPATPKGTPGKVPTVDGMGGSGGPPPLKQKPPVPRPLGDVNAQTSPRARQLATKTPSAATRNGVAVDTIRQVQGLVKLNKHLGVNPPAQSGSGTTGGGTGHGASSGDHCAKVPYADRKICYMQVAADAIQSDIDKMIAFENSLPDKGCLNSNPLTNRCNWSYKQFAEQIAYRRPDLDDARRCQLRIPDWSWLTDRAKQDKLIAQRMLYATDGGTTNPPIDYTSDITRVDAFVKALDDAPAKWAEYEKQRKDYLKYVASMTDQVKAIPGVGDNALGQSKSDGFDLGHPETFSAGAHYALSWGVTAVQMGQPTYSAEPGSACAPGIKCCNNIACGIEERVCRFNGAMAASADAKASVFGTPEVLLDAAFTAYAEDDAKRGKGKGAHMNAHFTFVNSEIMPADLIAGIDASSTGDFTLARPLADTSGQIPDPPIQVAFMVGPIPVTLEAGSVVSAGVDLSTTGIIGDTCSQKNVPPPFSLLATIAPRAKADAFGQAGVDLVAVSAGVRIDLNLLTLGLPLDVGFKTDASNVVFDTRADLVASALAGSVSLFAEIRYVVGSDTYELPVFSWSGVQGNQNLFDYNKSFPLDALSFRFFPPQVWRKL